MFNIPFKAGGGGFTSRFSSARQSIASSSSGVLFTLTPPSGQRVRLNFLALGTNSIETGITINVGADEVVNSKSLVDYTTNADNEFMISGGGGVGSSTAFNEAGQTPSITGKVDEEITVVKDAGSTANTIHYTYEFGN